MATLVVNPALGNDANTYAQVAAGTHQWASIGRAAWGSTDRDSPDGDEAAQAGDTVEVAGGVYASGGTMARYGVWFNPVNEGTAGNPIVFKAMGRVEPRRTPVFSGTITAVGAQSFTDTELSLSADQVVDHLVFITSGPANGRNELILDNTADTMTIGGAGGSFDWLTPPEVGDSYEIFETGPTLGSQNKDYVHWTADPTNPNAWWYIDERLNPAKGDTGSLVIVEEVASADGCLLEWVEVDGIETHWADNHNGVRLDFCDSPVVRNCWFKNINVTFTQGGTQSPNGAALMIYAATNWLFEHNRIDNCAGAIFPKGLEHTDGVVRFNLVKDCRMCRISFTSDAGQTEYYQNIFVRSGAYGFRLAESVDTLLFHHNTVYAPDTAVEALIGDHDYSNVQLTNNIFAEATSEYLSYGNLSTGDEPVSNYNIYYEAAGTYAWSRFGTQYTSLAAWQAASGEDANSTNNNPQFVDAANDDFHLSPGSPALTASSTGGPIGAYITGDEAIGYESREAVPPSGITVRTRLGRRIIAYEVAA